MDFGEEDHCGKVPFPGYHIRGIYQHFLPILILTLIIWLISCQSGFSTVKFLPPALSPLDTIFFGTKSLCQHLRNVRIMFHLLEGGWVIYINYLKLFYLYGVFVSSHSFTYSIICYISMVSWIFT